MRLCARLSALGHETVALHRKSSDIARLAALGVRCVACELADFRGLSAAMAGCEVAIHAAADIRSRPDRPDLQAQVNVEGSRNVALACRLTPVRRMIHVSSVSAIGIPNDGRNPAAEDFRFNLSGPAFAYHLSKKQAEEAVLQQVEAGLNAVIVNPGTIFGPHHSLYRGAEFIRGVMGKHVIPCVRGGRCAVHVDDAIGGILAAAEKGARGERYILGGENVSYLDMAKRSARALGVKSRFVPIPGWALRLLAPARAANARFHYYRSDKAGTALGYAPRGFDAIIADCLAWRPER
jgi:dihydroflavonol-4-reductase